MPREIEGLREWTGIYIDKGFPNLLSNGQAAEILGVSIPTIVRMKQDRRLQKKRKLTLFDIGRFILSK